MRDPSISEDGALAQLQLQRRLQVLDELLPALAGVLDVREVFERISTIARKVIPHDMLRLLVLTNDKQHIMPLAVTNGSLRSSEPLPIADAHQQLLDEWDFQIIPDIQSEPAGRTGPTNLAGYRSLLRVPIHVSGELAAGLGFYSVEPRAFGADLTLVARRVADHIALAISHQRLAEESRRAAVLQERAANLKLLDELLPALTGVLDIREVFDRVSVIAHRVLPHDALSIAESTDDGQKVRVHASHGLGDRPEPFEYPTPDLSMVTDPWEYRLIQDVRLHPGYAEHPATRAGMRSMLFVAIRLEGRLFGGLNFYSRTLEHFVQDDVLVARRIADHVALAVSHQRLAEESRRAAVLHERATNLKLLDELLPALSGVLDIREVFERVSFIARQVIPHDMLSLPLLTEDKNNLVIHAVTGNASQLPETVPLPEHHRALLASQWDHLIYADIQADPLERLTPPGQAGYRARLIVPIRLQGEILGGLDFFSLQPDVYTADDVLVARRIADHVVLTLSHQRLADESRRMAEARARAESLEARVQSLTEELSAVTGYRRVVGQSESWKKVLKQATQVAATDTTVLLLGESGTGKEVVARFIHRASGRSNGPFVALNCAALPEQLLESELFGFERGAFTGAQQAKPGQIEQAAGGVLFLDEVAEMSPSAQAKLLRVLQEREFQRLGGTRTLKANIRVVAATNRNLRAAMEAGTFREDLYYRLQVFEIRLPPLRERRDDVVPLSEAFLKDIAREFGRPPAGISREAREGLLAYHWPGNVRELRNMLERAAILCSGGLIAGEHLSFVAPLSKEPPVVPRGNGAATLPAPADTTDLRVLERSTIERALQDARYNKSQAAKMLGLSRKQLYVRLRQYGLE